MFYHLKLHKTIDLQPKYFGPKLRETLQEMVTQDAQGKCRQVTSDLLRLGCCYCPGRRDTIVFLLPHDHLAVSRQEKLVSAFLFWRHGCAMAPAVHAYEQSINKHRMQRFCSMCPLSMPNGNPWFCAQRLSRLHHQCDISG